MTRNRSNHGTARTERETETAFYHDWSGDEPLSTGIVSALADLSETDVTDVDRLYDRVDPDSLDAIFQPPNGKSTRNTGELSFRLGSYTVTVHASGFVVLTESP